jgi:hypothetical protein
LNFFFSSLATRPREVRQVPGTFGAEPEDIGVGFITVESLIDPFRADCHCVSRRRSQSVSMDQKGSEWVVNA